MSAHSRQGLISQYVLDLMRAAVNAKIEEIHCIVGIECSMFGNEALFYAPDVGADRIHGRSRTCCRRKSHVHGAGCLQAVRNMMVL